MHRKKLLLAALDTFVNIYYFALEVLPMSRNIASTFRVRCILLILGLAGFAQAIFPVNAYNHPLAVFQQTDDTKKTKLYTSLTDEPKYYVQGSAIEEAAEAHQIKHYVEDPNQQSPKPYTTQGKTEHHLYPSQAEINPSEGTMPLTSGVPVNSQIAGAPAGSCVLGNTQYTIQVPSGTTELRIVLSGNQDVDLFVRFGQMVAISGGQAVADYSSTSLSGNETIIITPSNSPPLQQGTYFIAIANCASVTANFTLTATVTGGGGPPSGCSGGTPLTSGVATNSQIAGAPAGSCALGNTQYTIQVPSGTTELRIVLSGNQDVDLFVRFGQMVAISGGQAVADYSSTSLSGNETIIITPSSSPPLQQGCYFIAIANCASVTANFTLTATASLAPQTLPMINLAFTSGKHVVVAGTNFDAGAVIIMNGVERKTRRDPENINILTGKKLAKKINHGETVMLQVKNSDGRVSPLFPFTRP